LQEEPALAAAPAVQPWIGTWGPGASVEFSPERVAQGSEPALARFVSRES